MISQNIIYACTAVAALAVAYATPTPARTIDAAMAENGASFCIAAYREARAEAPHANWHSQRLALAQQPIAQSGRPNRFTCVTEGSAPIRITFDVVCARADSWDCVQVRVISRTLSGALNDDRRAAHAS